MDKSYTTGTRSKGSRSGNSYFSSDSASSGGVKSKGMWSRRSVSSRFLDHFENKRWGPVRKLIKSNKGASLCREKDRSGISALTMALGYDAPIDIVDLILQHNPALAHETDNYDASPLHVACLNGAPVDSIRLLLERYPALATSLDCDDRTPLHHAVEYVCRMDSEEEAASNNILEAVEELCRVFPQAVFYGDKFYDTPLDLTHIVVSEGKTICSGSGGSSVFDRCEFVYDYLKSISIQVYLDNKRKWEEEGFDTSELPAKAIKDNKSQGTASTESTTASDS